MSLEGLKRGASILASPSYLYGAAKQLVATTGPLSGKYDLAKTGKPNLCLVPGWTCDLGTYHRLTKLLEENFNVLPLQNFPEGIGAVLSRLSIEDQVTLLMETLENSGSTDINLLGHSNGGVVAVLAQIRAEQKKTKKLIQKVVTLSSPLNGSAAVSEIPVISSWAQAIADLHPESAVIKEVQAKGCVDDFFVAEQDQLFNEAETSFHKGEKHEVSGGHFRYFQGESRVVIDTAARIKKALLPT